MIHPPTVEVAGGQEHDRGRQAEVWRRYGDGASAAMIARAMGFHATSVAEFIRIAGGIRPKPVCRSSRQLSLADREEISRGLAAGESLRGVARWLGRAPSTISREVDRDGGRGSYRALRAGLVDLDRARLLDVVDGRAGSAVSDWLGERDQPWLAAVERVALDPYRGYYNALVGGLDAPEVVVDAFHIVRLGNTVVDEVRRRVQQTTLGHRGHAGDPLYGIRRLLLTGYERLSDRGRQRLRAGLADGDPNDEVWYAHVVKEQLRAVYRADDEQTARVALGEFYNVAAAAGVPERDRLARTIRRWEPAVLAYYTTDRLSYARTEAINGLMKKVQRIGHGFRNLRNYSYDCCCTAAASHGKINPPRSYRSALPATWRRAAKVWSIQLEWFIPGPASPQPHPQIAPRGR